MQVLGQGYLCGGCYSGFHIIYLTRTWDGEWGVLLLEILPFLWPLVGRLPLTHAPAVPRFLPEAGLDGGLWDHSTLSTGAGSLGKGDLLSWLLPKQGQEILAR